jgi:hypothetical protein
MKRTGALALPAFVVLALSSLACDRHLPTVPVLGSASLVGTVRAVAPDGSRTPLGGASVWVTQCTPGSAEGDPSSFFYQCDDWRDGAVTAADGTYSITRLYAGGGYAHASATGFDGLISQFVPLPSGTTHLDIELRPQS